MTSSTRSASGFADIQGAQLYYEIAGNGPPLVLIHARIADSRMWDANWNALAAHSTVIRYDLRGHGKSTMPSGSFSHVADLAALLEWLAIDQVSVIGSSMGGEIALDFSLAYPEKVAKLIPVACAPGGYQWSPELEPKWAAIFGALEQGDFAGAVELELQLWVDGPQRHPDQVNRVVRGSIRAMDTANWLSLAEYRQRAQPSPPVNPPAVARLHEIKAPTLVIVGSADVPEILAGADMLTTHIPTAEKAIFEDAGHMLSMEQPERFNQRVSQFLNNTSGAF